MENMMCAYKVVRKPQGMRPLERPGCWWEDNIKLDLKEIQCYGVNWSGLW